MLYVLQKLISVNNKLTIILSKIATIFVHYNALNKTDSFQHRTMVYKHNVYYIVCAIQKKYYNYSFSINIQCYKRQL